jgi:hypothetical protein
MKSLSSNQEHWQFLSGQKGSGTGVQLMIFVTKPNLQLEIVMSAKCNSKSLAQKGTSPHLAVRELVLGTIRNAPQIIYALVHIS